MELATGKSRFTGVILCGIILLSGVLGYEIMFGWHGPAIVIASTNASTSSPLYFSYVVNIWMENKNYGSVLAGNSCCPYENQLANTHSTDPNYGSILSPSLPDYLGFLAGSYPSCASGDGDPASCNAGGQTNLIDRFGSAGLSWQAYAENYPVTQGCTTAGSSGSWYARHFPFNYYSDITGNTTRCNNIFNAGASDATFLSALNATSAWPNFVWLTPNGCNDTHDCSASTGDTYLSGLVPKILNSNMFKTGKAALVITWDEYNPAPNVEVGSGVKLAFKSAMTVNHYAWTHLILSNWGLAQLTSNDGGAPVWDVFQTSASSTPDFGLGANPPSVSFTTGSTGTSTITMSPLGGFAGSVALSSSSPSGVTTVCSPSTLSTTALMSTCTFSAVSAASGTVTITGTSGTLAHSASVSVTAASSGGAGNFVASQWSLTANSPSTATISNGVLTEAVVDTSSSYTGSFYSTAQYLSENGFGGPPLPVSSFSAHVNIGTVNTVSSGYLYHAYMGLYFTLPSSVTAGGLTSSWIDGQVQVEQCSSSISGGCDPAGYTYNSNLGNRFGYREILTTQGANTGYDFVNFDVQAFCARAEAAWGIPSTPCTLVRVEPGIEAYGVSPFSVTWTTFSVNGTGGGCTNGATNPPSCNVCPTGQSLINGICTTVSSISSVGITLSATTPVTGQAVTFQGTVVGGLAPYSYSWNFGDGSTGSSNPTSHAFTVAGTYLVVLTVSDSVSHTLTVSQTVIVTGLSLTSPVSLIVPSSVIATPGTRIAFVVNATDLNMGNTVVVTVTGLPSGASFDQSTRRFSWSPTSADLGSHNVTFTGTDNGSPPKSSAKSVLITVQQASQPPPSQPKPGPGVCLQCLFTPTALTSLWLVTIAGLVGMTGMIGAFYSKARARLAAARRMQRLNKRKQPVISTSKKSRRKSVANR